MTLTTIRQKVRERVIEEPAQLIVLSTTVMAALLLLYGYLMMTTVMNMVAYKQATAEAARISAELGSLEAEYIALGSVLSSDEAHALGFVDILNPQFVAATTLEPLALARAGTE